MSNLTAVIPLFVTLIICVMDGYSMCSYRLPAKQAYGCFAAVTAFCLVVNSYIVVCFGHPILQSAMLFTIGLPYLFLILAVTKDKISQTLFNFWLWINIYTFLSNLSEFVNHYTLRNTYFLVVLRCLLLCAYFFLYHKYLKAGHRRIIETLPVNWWIFSFIPMLFTVLIWFVKYYLRDFYRVSVNYPILLTVYALMLSVYMLIFYTFRTVNRSMEKEWLARKMKDQIILQKKQHEIYLQQADNQRIFRHNQRFRDSILLQYLESGDTEGARTFIRKELDEIEQHAVAPLCENVLINAILTEYRTKAEKIGLSCQISVKMPDTLVCDEAEFCVMLSNLLENSLDAAKSYMMVDIRHLNRQLLLKIENDYSGALKKDADGSYLTTKPHGSGLGLRSVNAILKDNHGFLKIDDKNGVFQVLAALNN